MKLATVRLNTPLRPIERFEIVRLDGGLADLVSSARAGAGWIIDANAAYAEFLAYRRERQIQRAVQITSVLLI